MSGGLSSNRENILVSFNYKTTDQHIPIDCISIPFEPACQTEEIGYKQTCRYNIGI